MKYSEFITNKEKENQGVEMEVGEGFFITVARLGNEKCKKFMEKANHPHLRRIRKGTLPTGIRDGILIKAIAKTVLLNWRGLEEEVLDDNGHKVIDLETGEIKTVEIPYSKEKAIELMTSSDDFLECIIEYSQDQQNFKDQDIEDAEGNLSSASNGNSNEANSESS